MARTPRLTVGALLTALALTLSACGDTASNDASASPSAATESGAAATAGASESATPAGNLEGTLTVFAAASLRDVLEPLGDDFTAQHPDLTMTYSFGGSSDLVAQLQNGAPADVLVTADERTMQIAEDGSLLTGTPDVIASNVLTIVTPPGNPAGVTGLDQSLGGTDLVVCAPQVPCGNATAQLSEAAGVTLTPVSEENSVTDVLGKVTSGQAQAGIVYVTDAIGAGDQVQTVDIANADSVQNLYPAAVVADSTNADAATAFVEFLASPDAQATLSGAGFSSAP